MKKLIFNVLALCFVAQFASSQVPVVRSEAEVCHDFCNDNMDKAMVEHCQRGCRFLGLAKASPNQELNSSSARDLCFDSCKEAYVSAGDKADACSKGCEGNLNDEMPLQDEDITKIMEVMENEAKKFDLFTSHILNQILRGLPFNFGESSDESDESKEEVVLIPYLNDGLEKPNPKDVFDIEMEVDVLANNGEDFVIVNGNSKSFLPSRSSFTLPIYGLIAGTFLLTFFFTICVIMARRVKSRRVQMHETEDSAPPSYDNIYKQNLGYNPEFGNMKAPLVDNAFEGCDNSCESLNASLEKKLNPV